MTFRTVLALLLPALCASTALAQQGADAETVIPASIIGGRPHVQVFVNGRGPFWFGVDTGAQGMGRADSALVAALSLPIDTARAAVTDGISTRQQNIAKIAELKLGPISLTDVGLSSRAYNLTSVNGTRLMGILGRDFFADVTLTIDYAKSELHITRRKLDPADPHTVSYERPFRIKARIGDREREFLIDSGFNDAMHIPLADTAVVGATDIHFEREVGTTQNRVKMFRGRIAQPTLLAGNRLDPVDAAFTAEIPYSSIGFLLLRQYVVSFDQRSKLVRIHTNH